MTPLLRRILRDYRAAILPIVFLLAVNVLTYVLVVRPLQLKSEGAADRAVLATQNLRTAQADLARARSLVDGTAQADTELSAFYQKVLPLDLTAARRMTYASLPALARRTNVRYAARTHTLDETTGKSRLGHMAIRMVLQGDYKDIRRFIHELETAPEFVIIDNVTLTESSGDEPQTLTLTLSTYYSAEPNGR